MSIMNSMTLVLNASYEPIHICAARRALTLVVKDAAIIKHDTGQEVHAGTGLMMPSVIMLRQYRRVPSRVQVLTRKNVLLRDRNVCQYCFQVFPASELTMDHVMPRSRGGLSTWTNLVAACKDCNRRKADRTPEEADMELLHKPRAVTLHTARHVLRQQGGEIEAWRQYLYF